MASKRAKRVGMGGALRKLYDLMIASSEDRWTHFIHPNATIISYVATEQTKDDVGRTAKIIGYDGLRS